MTWDIYDGKVATQWVVEYFNHSVNELRNCSLDIWEGSGIGNQTNVAIDPAWKYYTSATAINTSRSALKCKVSVFFMQGSRKGQQIKPHHLQLQELCRWHTILEVSNMEVFPARNLYIMTLTLTLTETFALIQSCWCLYQERNPCDIFISCRIKSGWVQSC